MTNPGQFAVPFGRGHQAFAFPPGVTGEEIATQAVPPIVAPLEAAQVAVQQPVAGPTLRELAVGARSVCIAVTDATRACPDHILVPPMLAEIAAAGVPVESVTILVAVGAHRASTAAEKREKLGDQIVDRYRVVDHDGSDPAQLVAILDGPGGNAFKINRIAAEADLLLSTGLVEPHQYAGFSGGGKTVAIGCGDDVTIAYTHGPAMLDLPGVRLAQLAGNPFQEAVRAVARNARLAFVGNAVMDPEGQIVAIAYGPPETVQDELAALATPLFTASIPSQVDIAVAGVGYPKDANLYQASRAASYLQFAPIPVVRRGGAIVIPAACPEGAGEGDGERRFFAAMSSRRPEEIIEQAQRDGIRPGEQRAYIMARVLQDVAVIVAGGLDANVTRAVGFLPAATIEAGLALAAEIVGTPAHALVVPHALLTLPMVQPSASAAAS